MNQDSLARDAQLEVSTNRDNFLDAYSLVRRVAQVRARWATRRYGILWDCQDLEQEGALEVWRKIGLFDSSRGSLHTYIERIIVNRLTSVARHLHSSRCGHGKERSLFDVSRLRAPEEGMALRADVGRVLASVTTFDRAVALFLIDHSAIATSRCLRVSRATVYRAIERLRVAFTAAGLAIGRSRSYAACLPNRDARSESRRQEPGT